MCVCVFRVLHFNAQNVLSVLRRCLKKKLDILHVHAHMGVHACVCVFFLAYLVKFFSFANSEIVNNVLGNGKI